MFIGEIINIIRPSMLVEEKILKLSDWTPFNKLSCVVHEMYYTR